MKKMLSTTVLLFVLMFIRVPRAQAAEIMSIDVEAVLHLDGSATITEIWTTADIYEGTQISRIMDLPNTMRVHSLEVQQADGIPFEIVTDWQTRATFDERAGHASILTTNAGYEIIWGITEHGENRYEISYTLEGLVQDFAEGTHMHFHFVPAGITPTPNEVSLQLSASDVDLAQVEFELLGMSGDVASTSEGAILAHSNGSFSEGDSLTIRAQFPHGLFTPTVQNSTNYNELNGTSSGRMWLTILISLVAIATAIIVVIKKTQRTKLSDGTIIKWPSINEIPVKSELPFKMNLPLVYAFIMQSSPFYTKAVSSAFGAYLLKWSHEGIIEMSKVKSKYLITLHPLQTNLSEIEYMLYEILEHAVDDHRQISSKATKTWETVMKKINEWEDELYEHGVKELVASGIIVKDEKNKVYFTPTGYEALLEFWGFIKYLKEQHKANDVSQPFEHDHLVIASMSGLKKELKKYFKHHVDQSDDMFIVWQMMWMVQAFDNQVHASYESSDGGGSFSAGSAAGGGGGGIS